MEHRPANRNWYWMCPYFKYDLLDGLSCEAGRLMFPTQKSAEEYLRRFCAANPGWEKCSIARAYNETAETAEK